MAKFSKDRCRMFLFKRLDAAVSEIGNVLRNTLACKALALECRNILIVSIIVCLTVGCRNSESVDLSEVSENSTDYFHALVIDAYDESSWDTDSLPHKFIFYGNARFLKNPRVEPWPNIASHSAFLHQYAEALTRLWSGYSNDARSLIEGIRHSESKAIWSQALKLELYDRLDRQDMLSSIIEEMLASKNQEVVEVAYPYALTHLESICDWDRLEALINADVVGGRVERFQLLVHEASMSFARGDAERLLTLLDENRAEYSTLFEYKIMESNWIFLSRGYSAYMSALAEIYDEFSSAPVTRPIEVINQIVWGAEIGSDGDRYERALDEYIAQYGADVRGVFHIAIELAKYGKDEQFKVLLRHLEGQLVDPSEFVNMLIVRAYNHMIEGDLDEALRLLNVAVEKSPGNRDAHLARVRVADEMADVEVWEESVIRLNECDPFDDESIIFLRRFVNLVGSDKTHELFEDIRRHRHLFSEPMQRLMQ